jgi:hypothetical protein
MQGVFRFRSAYRVSMQRLPCGPHGPARRPGFRNGARAYRQRISRVSSTSSFDESLNRIRMHTVPRRRGAVGPSRSYRTCRNGAALRWRKRLGTRGAPLRANRVVRARLILARLLVPPIAPVFLRNRSLRITCTASVRTNPRFRLPSECFFMKLSMRRCASVSSTMIQRTPNLPMPD